jgi:uncharacterized membrane protein YeiH
MIDPSDVIVLPLAVELTAVSFGALSGALHATRRGMDPFGVFVIALLCAVGGGIIRDILLQTGRPVFLLSTAYLSIAAFASVVGLVFARLVRSAVPVMSVVDTLLIGAWVVLGAERGLAVSLTYSGAAFVGIITATGGGLVRDLLCREVPSAIRPGEWYVAAAIVAAVGFVFLVMAGAPLVVAEVVTIAVAALLRAGSVYFGWRTPTAYDLWGGLEARVAAGLEVARAAADERARRRGTT